jgi:uroporphyrinogen decarboxylase
MMRRLDERILIKFGSDFRRVTIKNKKVESNLSKGSNGEFIDSWGIPRKVIGYYSEITNSPLSDLKDIKELDEHPWPNADDYEDEGIKEKAIKLEEEGWAVIGDQPVDGSIFDVAWMLRGFENFMIDLYINPGIAEAIMDRVLEVQMSLYGKLLKSVGEHILVVVIGEDFGSQEGLIISPDMFRKYLKPRNKELFDFIHKKTSAKLMLHSCGSIEPIIGDLIQIGVDIINPIQTSARGMEPELLKKKWGDKVCFSGGIDTQSVLPFGSPQDVENEVKKKIKELAPGGGYILAAVHNIQEGVKPENIVTLFSTAQKIGHYPLQIQ